MVTDWRTVFGSSELGLRDLNLIMSDGDDPG
jgi:hypothetical protein